jgi:xylulose-5-phosphate/fructose-6-phosphate phosphoketolase
VIEVEGSDLPGMHHRFAAALATAYSRLREIQQAARSGRWDRTRPRWPMIILRSPKGWTGPAEVDGVKVTGTWRSHQVPLSGVRESLEHLRLLENWLRSYHSDELFDERGAPVDLVLAANVAGDLRMSASRHANGGLLRRKLDLPDFRHFSFPRKVPGQPIRRIDPEAR